MPIEAIMENFKNTEQEMLIESMEKLLEHIYENRSHQEEIFKSLSLVDLEKMFKNMQNPNPVLRKISANFLCEILYNNRNIQNLFCEYTGLIPMQGKVCLNRIPDAFKPFSKLLPQILNSIRLAEPPDSQNPPLCWYFQPKNSELGEKGVEYKIGKGDFIDPMENLVGFFVAKEEKMIEKIEKNEQIDKNDKIEKNVKKKAIEKPKTATSTVKSLKTESDKSSGPKLIRPKTEKRGNEDCRTDRPLDKFGLKHHENETLYRTAEKVIEVGKISLLTETTENETNEKISKTTTNIGNKSKNAKTRLLSPQILPTSKKNYSSLIPAKKPIVKENFKKPTNTNNFMSIVETTKREGGSTIVSQSVINDYNIKVERKPTQVKQTKIIKPLQKKGPKKVVNTSSDHLTKEVREIPKKTETNYDSFGPNNIMEIEEIPESPIPVEKKPSQQKTPRTTENILLARKSQEFSYFDVQRKKRSFIGIEKKVKKEGRSVTPKIKEEGKKETRKK